MKRAMMMLTAVLALTVNVPVWAADSRPAAAAPPAREKTDKGEARAARESSGLKGQYAIMASELKMTPDQQAQLKQKLDARDAAIKAWNEANGAKLTELQKSLAEAQKNKDSAKAKEIKPEVEKLVSDREKIAEGSKSEIQSILTPEQKKAWAGYEVYVGATQHFAHIKLSDEQKVKARQLAQDASVTLPEAGNGRKAALNALYSKIETEVLTPEQRDQLKAASAPRAKPEAKAKEAPPVPAPAVH